jgi:hypothetical protein
MILVLGKCMVGIWALMPNTLIEDSPDFFTFSRNIKVFRYSALNYGTTACSVVGIATAYWLDDWGIRIRVPVGLKIVTSPYHSGLSCDPVSLLSNVYWWQPYAPAGLYSSETLLF